MAKYFDINSFLAEQEGVPVVFNSGCTGLGKEMDKQNEGHDVSKLFCLGKTKSGVGEGVCLSLCAWVVCVRITAHHPPRAQATSPTVSLHLLFF